ncbi:MAG: response regulator [Anaerolineae bacterium]|nr:response regulator [Anaerolineae bacterium]
MITILIIDDNADYRTDIAAILQFEAYHVLEAENGQIGLQMIRQHSPNLILCDVDMPIMGGIEVLRTVKTNPIWAQIPFFIVTGHHDKQTMKTARDLGATAYLTKPLAVTNLLSTIAQFVSE